VHKRSSNTLRFYFTYSKKKDISNRVCVDFCHFKKFIKCDNYPIPLINNFTIKLSGFKIYSKIDLRDKFYNLRVSDKSCDLVSMRCHLGRFTFNVMPFGLKNGSACFQRYLDNVFYEDLNKNIFIYINNIMIATEDIDQHGKLLDKVFSLLLSNNLKGKW
jgi:Reverse transcriptase (RNA-dependent DNA polymerase)